MAGVAASAEQDKFEEEIAKVLGHLTNISKQCKLLADSNAAWRLAATPAAASAGTNASATSAAAGPGAAVAAPDAGAGVEAAARTAQLALTQAAKKHAKAASSLLRGIEDDAATSASIITYLRHVHRMRREELRQIKVMSNPQLHVPSRRTKIIAQPLAQNVSFEELKRLAKAKLKRDRPKGSRNGRSRKAARKSTAVPASRTMAAMVNTTAAAPGAAPDATASAPDGAAAAATPARGPAQPSAATLRMRNAKRRRSPAPADGTPSTKSPETAAAVAKTAALATKQQAAPRHPGRTEAEQQAHLQSILMKELSGAAEQGSGEGAKAPPTTVAVPLTTAGFLQAMQQAQTSAAASDTAVPSPAVAAATNGHTDAGASSAVAVPSPLE